MTLISHAYQCSLPHARQHKAPCTRASQCGMHACIPCLTLTTHTPMCHCTDFERTVSDVMSFGHSMTHAKSLHTNRCLPLRVPCRHRLGRRGRHLWVATGHGELAAQLAYAI